MRGFLWVAFEMRNSQILTGERLPPPQREQPPSITPACQRPLPQNENAAWVKHVMIQALESSAAILERSRNRKSSTLLWIYV